MKLSSLICLSLLFISSFVYADIISDLQTKKNNTQKTGISYTVVIPGESEGDSPKEYVMTEKGNSKLFEYKENHIEFMYLITDNKLYQIPGLLKTEKKSPVPVTVLTDDAKSNIEEETEKFKFPDYKGFKVVGKSTVNGYQCQILQKVVSSREIQEDKNDKFVAQDSIKIYVIEKYGYPAKIENIFTSKDMKGKVLHNEVQNTIDFVKFTTNISDKILSLPKNAMVVDPLNKNMFDANAIKQQYLQMMKEQYSEDAD
ncbi:MAG: hypothetical protein K5622_02455 [Endomicrobiaceae bacterium]|nr:hypothetical protein [Endomicrobiaceae bacterium]